MRLFARKNKAGKKLLDEDDEEEQDIKNSSNYTSPTSILGVKDENVFMHTSSSDNNNELFDGSPLVGGAPLRLAAQQQRHRMKTSLLSYGNNTTARQLFNSKEQTATISPPNRATTSATVTASQTRSPNYNEWGVEQDLFSVRKLQQHRNTNGGSTGSNSCYSDASSNSIGANNENESPSSILLVLDTPQHAKKGHVTLSNNLGGRHNAVSPMLNNTPQQANKNITPTSTIATTQSQHHQTTSADCKKQEHAQQQQPQRPHYEQEHLQFVRNALRRPFGRDNLPPSVIEWEVKVACPTFLKDQWMYNITIEQKSGGNEVYRVNRSLRDICLLELALLQEFSGSLLVPVLELYCIPADGDDTNEHHINNQSSIDITKDNKKAQPLSLQDLLNSSEAVEPDVLQGWLTDVIHGIRGEGEVLLKHASPQQVMHSEAMGIFLTQFGSDELIYKNLNLSATVAALAASSKKNTNTAQLKPPTSTLGPDTLLRSMFSCFNPGAEGKNSNAVADFFPKCASRSHMPSDMDEITGEGPDNMALHSSVTWKEHVETAHFSSRHGRENFGVPNNSDILDAHRLYYQSFIALIPSVQQRINKLLQLETVLGAAWKRFAISLSNLLAFEKEFLECKISSSSSSSLGNNNESKMPEPFKKNEVDDGLRLLARNKLERGTLGLQALHIMIETLHTDAISVPRSLNIYLRSSNKQVVGGVFRSPGGNKLHQSPNHNTLTSSPVSADSAERVKQYVVQKIDLVKKQLNLGSESFASTTLDEFDDVTTNNSVIEENFTKHSPSCDKILADEAMLLSALGKLSQAMPIRISRMSWKYFKVEAAQAASLSSAAAELKSILPLALIEKHFNDLQYKRDEECAADDAVEKQLVVRILDLSGNDDSMSSQREIALQHFKEQIGRWDAQFTLTIMAVTGVVDAEVRVEETTRALRYVKNIAIELRKCVDRCVEASEALMTATYGIGKTKHSLSDTPIISLSGTESHLTNVADARGNFLVAVTRMFSAALTSKSTGKTPSNAVFAYAGININDPSGWLSAVGSKHKVIQGGKKRSCGKAATDYFAAKERDTSEFLAKVAKALREYEERVERIESYVYMHCVGIQLEKHFSKVRADSLAEWEKKTDLTQAITMATRKQLPQLVKELELKLESLDSKISHTYVKQAKERHLASKNIKAELQELADKRLGREKESAMEQIVGLIRMWAEYEETNAAVEVTVVENVIQEVERCVRDQDVEADGGAHQFNKSD